MSEDTFGQYLKSQRELRQISLEEVAAGTKIGIHLLRALEEDKWDVLPAEVFIKGFIKSYAEYIGLDPEDTILRYEAIKQKDIPQKEQEQELNIPRSYNGPLGLKSSVFLRLLIAVIIILLIGVGIYFISKSSIKLDLNILNQKKQRIEKFINNTSSINLNHKIIQNNNSSPDFSKKETDNNLKAVTGSNSP